ncbi:MAG: hypothetical protein AB3N18_08620 [Allomuricauda sp.]
MQNNTSKTIKFFFNRFKHGMILYTIRNLLGKFGFDVRPFYTIVENIGADCTFDINADYGDFKIKKLQKDEIKKALALTRIKYDLDKVLNDIAGGHICLGLFKDDTLLSYMFVDFGPTITYTSYSIRLEEKEAYALNMYTFEQHRGKNYSVILRKRSGAYLNDIGILRLYSIVSYFNRPSLNVHAKIGAKRKSLTIYINLLGVLRRLYSFKISS